MHRDSPAPRRTTSRSRARRSPSRREPSRSPVPSLAPSGRRFARGRHLDPAGDDLLLQFLDTLTGSVRDQRAVVLVIDVADAAFREPVRVDAALERAFLDALDRVEGDRV